MGVGVGAGQLQLLASKAAAQGGQQVKCLTSALYVYKDNVTNVTLGCAYRFCLCTNTASFVSGQAPKLLM